MEGRVQCESAVHDKHPEVSFESIRVHISGAFSAFAVAKDIVRMPDEVCVKRRQDARDERKRKKVK